MDRHIPDDIRVEREIAVGDEIAETRRPRPLDFRHHGPHGFRRVLHGLPDYLPVEQNSTASNLASSAVKSWAADFFRSLDQVVEVTTAIHATRIKSLST